VRWFEIIISELITIGRKILILNSELTRYDLKSTLKAKIYHSHYNYLLNNKNLKQTITSILTQGYADLIEQPV